MLPSTTTTTSTIEAPRAIGRGLQWVYSLLSFALIASISYDAYGEFRYLLATGSLAFVFYSLILVAYAVGLYVDGLVLVELVVEAILVLLVLIAGILSAIRCASSCKYYSSNDRGLIIASIVFMWLLFSTYLFTLSGSYRRRGQILSKS